MLNVKNITFSYNPKHTETPVLKDLDFTVEQGDHLSIIGESGSGKSTLLKLIYGEYDLNEGQIFWKDNEILGPKYNLVVGYEYMKYVAQEFDLMPFITVEENVGKHLSNFFPEEKKERIKELLNVVELQDFAKTKVKTLSGGQKQRVALARALAKQPEIILLDEPFSHIDNFQKQSLRRSVFKYLKEKKITCLVATHDKEDVLGFADRMLVLHDSKIIANDSPQELYRNPETPLIASFFGEVNMLNDQIIYAHQLQAVADSDLKARVVQNYFKGPNYLIEAEHEDAILRFEHPTALEVDLKVFLKILER
ncbi:ABC transporter ATP-binding protein [Gelidibacter salicanalis]|uniref:ABC transporter ATP-binding protein n=1 Tax=Gelidibacter salicanalis TaxID=291193 RepID=A0A934NHB9_9FLAO|nr:ABC transporter ATP-binding protein [Gelidibacter salicanalis]MBJ7879523.1 ABC transporter ATP-binding protein [Gelidibacter salicanalis]